MIQARACVAAIVLAASLTSARAQDDRSAVAAPVGTRVATLHAVGAQIYICEPDDQGALAWRFREPIATLTMDGKTVGRHFAGPSWEMSDGSLVVGKVTAKAAGAGAADIPWLKLDVIDHRGQGLLDTVTTVQRIATVGGVRSGPCPASGLLVAEPYAADYVFSHP